MLGVGVWGDIKANTGTTIFFLINTNNNNNNINDDHDFKK